MTNEDWQCHGWDDHEIFHLETGRRMSFRSKLQWLENADRMVQFLPAVGGGLTRTESSTSRPGSKASLRQSLRNKPIISQQIRRLVMRGRRRATSGIRATHPPRPVDEWPALMQVAGDGGISVPTEVQFVGACLQAMDFFLGG